MYIGRGVVLKAKGYTLVELLITLVIAAVGLALAVPTVENITQRRQTTAKAEQLASFLASARSEAVKSNQLISVQLSYTDEKDWCIGANESPDGCDCTTVNDCQIGVTEYTLKSTGDNPDETPVEIKTKMLDRSDDEDAPLFEEVFAFDPVRGIKLELVEHQYAIQSDNDEFQLSVHVSPTGRVSVCNSDADKAVPGHKNCP